MGEIADQYNPNITITRKIGIKTMNLNENNLWVFTLEQTFFKINLITGISILRIHLKENSCLNRLQNCNKKLLIRMLLIYLKYSD